MPKFTGPMVQSVMDTLQNPAVLVFVFIVFYIVLSFSLCYHIAFGQDIPEYATYAEASYGKFLEISLISVGFRFSKDCLEVLIINLCFNRMLFLVQFYSYFSCCSLLCYLW
jgi:hypothetical protein